MTFDLQIETVQEGHIDPYVRLARSEYGDDAPDAIAAHVRWKFLDNPQGTSTGIHLYRRGELVGRMIASPRKFLHAHKTYTAAYIVDLLVHREHRGMIGLLQLVDGLNRLAGFDFILIPLPNPAGLTVWKDFVKLPECFELDVAVVPLRPAKLFANGRRVAGGVVSAFDIPWRGFIGALSTLRTVLGGEACETKWPATADVESMFSADWGNRVVGERTPAFLEWRFRRSPLWKYDISFVRDQGQLAGYLVSRRTNYRGCDCCFVVDAYGHPELRRQQWSAVVRRTVAREARDGAAIIMLVGNTCWGSLSAVAGLPFINVPGRFLPRRTSVVAKWLTEPAFAFRPETLYLTLADCDLV